MEEIPNFLFRGDSDPKRQRNLKGDPACQHGLIWTNCANESYLEQTEYIPVKEGIGKHVRLGWPQTPFLSFSENKNVALCYGLGRPKEGIDLQKDTDALIEEMGVDEYLDNDSSWDFALFTLAKENLETVKKISKGIYAATYLPASNRLSQKLCSLLLINVSEFVKNDDWEWLIAPLNSVDLNFGTVRTGLLDTGCLQITRYQ